MDWLIPALLALLILGLLALIVVLATDGRFFGKRLMRWVYDRFGPALFGARSEEERWLSLFERLALRGDESVLDVGTAVGDLPLTLASLPNFYGRVVGLDWSPPMMAAARSEAADRGLAHQLSFEVADVRQGLPYADNTFDLVFCLGLLETLPRPERILVELTRVLSPAGVLVVSCYRGWAARFVARSERWYREQLVPLGITLVDRLPRGRNEEFLIGRRLPD